ncbi:MAG: hypothetical protein R2762_05325 [Bryobacteraceae bacterium]
MHRREKSAAAVAAFVGVMLGGMLLYREPSARVVEAAGQPRFTVLLRFGLDGAKAVDWSGSISPAPSALTGWQFADPDRIGPAEGAWSAATVQQNYWDTPYEARMGPTARLTKVTTKGVVATFDAAAGSSIGVHTAQGDFTFKLDNSLWDAPQRFLNGKVEVRAAPVVQSLKTPEPVEDYPSMTVAGGDIWLAYQAWTPAGDRILVRKRSGTAWSDAFPVTTDAGDCFRTAIAQDRKGNVWVVWSRQTNGNFDLWGARASSKDPRKWSRPERLTSAPGSDIYHSLQRAADGKLYLAWQSARSGNFDIYLRTYDGSRWSTEQKVSESAANDWEPTIAAANDGRVTVLWDTYDKGNYDVVSRTIQNGAPGPVQPIAATGAFEARPSAQYDKQGRLWIAWEEGDWLWGKDYGNLIPESGRGLMVRRQTRVGVLAGGRLLEPAAPIADAVPAEYRQAFLAPRLVLSSSGAPVLLFRYRTNLPQGLKGDIYRGMWRAGSTRLAAGRWTPMTEFPEGFGRIDAPAAAVADGNDSLAVAWVTDGRLFPHAFPVQQDLHLAAVPAPPGPPGDLAPYAPPQETLFNPHANETADVARIRAHRVRAGGREYRIVRGDIHRHTDISWDGNRDGSLHDSYRYALDAVSFDFLGVCDHQAGGGVPYHWEMIQKAVDLFTIPGRFAPVYSYERSLSWPNGHRNVVFAKRGNPILPIPEAEQRGKEGAGKLYEYLRKLGGITTSHTSATGAGTDWRDSDPEVEPVVEIYQGYRTNYEGPGNPRAVTEQARYAPGFVWNAWDKGIKMGVQASSDHVSTHMSYAAAYVTEVTAEAILEAIRARRTFAATDNIVMDVRAGESLMGSAVRGLAALSVRVRGTRPLKRVVVVKNKKVVYTATSEGPEVAFTFTDPDTAAGERYYYVRAEQDDGQLAWSSPIWQTTP